MANLDKPGVIAPPPLIALASVLLGLALDWLIPARALEQIPFAPRMVIMGVLSVGGFALAVAGILSFRSVGTNPEPWKPALHLAQGGIYKVMRNPMYVGIFLLVVGLGIGLASLWVVALTIPMMLVLHNGVVLREERYLEAKFGLDYRRYKERVPRYGLF